MKNNMNSITPSQKISLMHGNIKEVDPKLNSPASKIMSASIQTSNADGMKGKPDLKEPRK
jgi:hypothetical protein